MDLLSELAVIDMMPLGPQSVGALYQAKQGGISFAVTCCGVGSSIS